MIKIGDNSHIGKLKSVSHFVRETAVVYDNASVIGKVPNSQVKFVLYYSNLDVQLNFKFCYRNVWNMYMYSSNIECVHVLHTV